MKIKETLESWWSIAEAEGVKGSKEKLNFIGRMNQIVYDFDYCVERNERDVQAGDFFIRTRALVESCPSVAGSVSIENLREYVSRQIGMFRDEQTIMRGTHHLFSARDLVVGADLFDLEKPYVDTGWYGNLLFPEDGVQALGFHNLARMYDIVDCLDDFDEDAEQGSVPPFLLYLAADGRVELESFTDVGARRELRTVLERAAVEVVDQITLRMSSDRNKYCPMLKMVILKGEYHTRWAIERFRSNSPLIKRCGSA